MMHQPVDYEDTRLYPIVLEPSLDAPGSRSRWIEGLAVDGSNRVLRRAIPRSKPRVGRGEPQAGGLMIVERQGRRQSPGASRQ
jgi:hypothetical protein